jgi:hypothetical protein
VGRSCGGVVQNCAPIRGLRRGSNRVSSGGVVARLRADRAALRRMPAGQWRRSSGRGWCRRRRRRVLRPGRARRGLAPRRIGLPVLAARRPRVRIKLSAPTKYRLNTADRLSPRLV